MIGVGVNSAVLTGLAAMNRQERALNTSLERLATGKRINRASDDPAGLIASDSMTAELRSISKKIDGYAFEDKRLGAVDGAQSALSDLLLDLNGLVVQSANRAALSPSERQANQDQADSILQAIDHVAATTTFDGQKIIEYLSSKNLGLADLASGGTQNLIDGDAEQAQHSIESAIDNLSTQRAGLGIREKDIQSEVRQLQEQFGNLSSARSQIVDTDYAAEMSKLMRATVLREAARFVTQLALNQNAAIVKSLIH